MPAAFKAKRTGLFLEICELSTGHFVQVDFGSWSLKVAFKGCVLAAYRFPIEGNTSDPFRIKAGITLGAGEGFDN
ncbi:hypothetical protein D3C80_1692030 [compost metagenome]